MKKRATDACRRATEEALVAARLVCARSPLHRLLGILLFETIRDWMIERRGRDLNPR